MANIKGFTACGQYYEMGDPQTSYIEYCQNLLIEIKCNTLRYKKMKTTNQIFKEVLIELGFAESKPSELSNSDYWMATEKAMEQYADQFKIKSEKWDKLDDEIGKFYEDIEEESDLLDVGETAALAFGYL